MPVSRRGGNNDFCKSLASLGHRTDLLGKIANAGSIRELTEIVNPGGRHYKLNLHALSRHGTVEFRHPSGTQNPAKVLAYLLMYLHLVKRARSGFMVSASDSPLKAVNKLFKSDVLIMNWMPRRLLDLANVGARAVARRRHAADGNCTECRH